MTDEQYDILKEFSQSITKSTTCLTDDMVLTYMLEAELTVIYSIVHFKYTLICVIMILLNKAVMNQKHN